MMNRIGTIRTRVRPVKKLFIVEKDDLKRLIEIIKIVSKEVAGLSNLIMTNDQLLFSENTIKFVNRHDPDIIINYSSCNDDRLSACFRLKTLSGKRRDTAIKHLSTPISIIDNVPYVLGLMLKERIRKYYSCFEEKTDPFSLAVLVNYGIIEKDYKGLFRGTVFERVKVFPITSLEKFFIKTEDIQDNFLNSSLDLANITDCSSIWHRDYNPNGYFKKNPTLIFGYKDDVRSIAYFWNMRATYPYNDSVWFPVELIQEAKQYFSHFTHYCNFTDSEIRKHLTEIGHLTEINGSQYYFNECLQEWDTFENFQNISIVDNRIRITHPFEKLFSRMGYNVNLMLDVDGLGELHLPKSCMIGDLFIDLPENKSFDYYFARTHKTSLSVYAESFEPFRNDPIIKEIKLPETIEIFQTFFNERKLEIKESSTTAIANQAVDLLGGYSGLTLLSNKFVFDLLVKIAPKRTDNLVRALLKKLDVTEDNKDEVADIIRRKISSMKTFNSYIVVDLDTIWSLMGLNKEQRKEQLSVIEELYRRKILLRGKGFSCPYCNSRLWYPLELIREENKCYGCNQQISIPIFEGDDELGDYFRLNELIATAVDQGILALLLTMNFLFRQRFYMKRFINNYEVYRSDGSEKLAEIDLIFTLGSKIGLCEVKADRGFQQKQMDRMLSIAGYIDADLLLFSTLKDRNSTEVRELFSYLSKQGLKVPAFILARDTLFNNALIDIGSYFEVQRSDNEFRHGPIIV